MKQASVSLFLLLLLLPLHHLCHAISHTANPSTTWNNSKASLQSIPGDHADIRVILTSKPQSSHGSPIFALGFLCSSQRSTYYTLAILRLIYGKPKQSSSIRSYPRPQVVWSANPGRHVKENATLELTGDGDLKVRDVDGSLVWLTKTAGKSVVVMFLTQRGNLVLLDAKNTIVWQSCDHSAGTLPPWKSPMAGSMVTTKESVSNTSKGKAIVMEEEALESNDKGKGKA